MAMGADDNDNEKEGVGGRRSGEGCGDDRIMSVAGCDLAMDGVATYILPPPVPTSPVVIVTRPAVAIISESPHLICCV